MGHIVNSISTRLGWFDTWKDDIYLEFYNHCDYLHHFIRIRFFLIYLFFSKRPWDRYLIIFSHFYLYKHKRVIHLNIFVYLGQVCLFSQDQAENFFLFAKRMLKKRQLMRKSYSVGLFNNKLMMMAVELFSEQFGREIDNLEVEEFITEPDKIWKWETMRKSWEYYEDSNKYFPVWHDDPITQYSKFGKFVDKPAFSLDFLKVMIRLYRKGAKVMRNKVKVLRRIALRSYLQYSSSIGLSFKKYFETMFILIVYSPYFSWLCEFVEHVVGLVYLPGQIKASYMYFGNDYVNASFISRFVLRNWTRVIVEDECWILCLRN